MNEPPKETTKVHIRLLKCTLEVENSRAYWEHADGSAPVIAQQAFDEYWFGARSLARVRMLLANFRARFDAFPSALFTLHGWSDMMPDTRRLVCHWHTQLSDPLYWAFSGIYLPHRREGHHASVALDLVVDWLKQQGPAQWQMSTRIKFASKLLTTAHAAGIVAGKGDPRSVVLPRVEDEALAYLFYLLREVRFSGTLLDNPYLRSVGLADGLLEQRLRRLGVLQLRRQGDLVDFEWRYDGLAQWAECMGNARRCAAAGGAP